MAAAALLACDWGTTNLRGWALDAAGNVVSEAELPIGVSTLSPGEAAQRFEREVRPALGARNLPAILCGMVGSNLGWALAPYADCPAGFADLARSALQVAPQVRIIPGLRCAGLTGAPDVMRGEETQVLGWLAQSPDRQRGRHLICHPGTHAKWVVVEDGRIVRFVTAMTGELFSVLLKYSVLKSDAPATDSAAFAAGLAAAGDGSALGARLFSARSRVAGGDAKAESTPSYLSGCSSALKSPACRTCWGARARRLSCWAMPSCAVTIDARCRDGTSPPRFTTARQRPSRACLPCNG